MDNVIPPEIVALAKAGLAPLGGAIIYHAIRPAKTLGKFVTNATACVLCGLLFTAPVLHWFGISPAFAGGVGAGLGLCGLVIASGVIRALERLDFGVFLPKAKDKS
jgi:hypothetical protein